MFEKLNTLEEKYDELTTKLSDPAVIANQEKFREYARSHAELGDVVKKYREYQQVSQEIAETKELLKSETDEEMIEFVKEELTELEPGLDRIEQDLRMLLIPKESQR